MTTRKLAVTVPEGLVEEARRAVRAGGFRSVSAYVTEAMRNSRHRQTLDGLLVELDEANPVPPDVRRWADEQIERAGGASEGRRAAG